MSAPFSAGDRVRIRGARFARSFTVAEEAEYLFPDGAVHHLVWLCPGQTTPGPVQTRWAEELEEAQ